MSYQSLVNKTSWKEEAGGGRAEGTSVTSDWLSPHSWQRLSTCPPNPENKEALLKFSGNKNANATYPEEKT